MTPRAPVYVRKVRAFPAAGRPRREPLLPRFDMELTERCDNDCIHCCINRPAGDAAAKAAELSTAEVKRLLAEGAALGALTVRFTGGEPLLRDDFREIYLAARRLGLKVILFTNARGITPALVDLFARVPPLETIEVSVYGMHRRSYEAVSRRPGSFREFRRGVRLLLDRGIPFVVKGAVLPPNRGERREFERWALTIPGMDKRPPAYSLFFDPRHRRDNPAKERAIRRLRLPPREGAAWQAEGGPEYFDEMNRFGSKFLGPPGAGLFRCGMGRRVCIDAYGKAQGCLPLRAPEMAFDLRQGSLKEAVTRFFPLRAAAAARNPAYLERCARCFLKSLCEQCPAQSFLENGTFDTPVEYLCDVAHAQAAGIGLIAEGEKAWTIGNWRERIRRVRLTARRGR
ncbi:MAG: radical SAM protein [Acidobacteriota bacterium]|nr:radical SAM protein [Acidobacteriota bacterium]